MPANDGQVRERVAKAEEAAALIEALPVRDGADSLSWDAILEIRASSQSAVALARRFGVSGALVGKVRRGELYKTSETRRSRVTGDRAGWAWPSTPECVAQRSGGPSGSTCSGTPTRSWSRSPRATRGRAGACRWSARSRRSCARSGCASGDRWQDRSSPARMPRASGRHARTGPGRRPISRVTLHEARHTYASFLMAAGYNLAQIQEYLGHADLVTTARYIKNLPVPRGTTAREKLEAYLDAELGDIDP
jgi:Phage integrase family